MSTKLRLWTQPIKSGLLWTGSGITISVTASKLLLLPAAVAPAVVYSKALIVTTFWSGTFLILLPLGVTRGILTSTINVVNTSEQQLSTRLLQQQEETRRKQSKDHHQQQQSIYLTKEPLEQYMTMGSGYRGQVFRLVASPFFPSTAQMLVRIQQTIDETSTRATNDHQIVSSAIAGYIEGYLQDKKDTITTIGCVLYTILIGIGFGVDRLYKNADEKRRTVQNGIKTYYINGKRGIEQQEQSEQSEEPEQQQQQQQQSSSTKGEGWWKSTSNVILEKLGRKSKSKNNDDGNHKDEKQ
jgi:hypothetical protein